MGLLMAFPAAAAVIVGAASHHLYWGMGGAAAIMAFLVGDHLTSPSVVCVEIRASTLVVRSRTGDRSVPLSSVREIRRGSGWSGGGTSAKALTQEWKGEPASTSRAVLFVAGGRRCVLMCVSPDDAAQAEQALRRALESPPAPYRS